MKRFTTESEIFEIVEKFELATIGRDEWKHAEHLTVALVYLLRNDDDKAYRLMRNGIFKLLTAYNVDFSAEMPYHETLTVFWLKTVSAFIKKNRHHSLVKLCNDLISEYEKDYPLKFYSREHLFSDQARAKFVEGDLV